MQQLRDDVLFFLKQKVFAIWLFITTVGCYGFAITHESIGVDDTLVDIYVQDGLTVVMGRWTMFLVNKFFHFGEYIPFITEFAGAIMLLTAVVLFCVLFKRILNDRVGIWGYTAFACIFISYPFISETNVYYFHNGVDLGYILCALSLLFFLNILDKRGKSVIPGTVCSMLLLGTAVGCYESFIFVYIIGVILILFFRGMVDREKITCKLLIQKLFLCFCVVAGCIILRILMNKVIFTVFSLQKVGAPNSIRSASDGLRQLFHQENWLSDVVMLFKKYWMVYCVNSVIYFPITIYMLSVTVFGVASLVCAIRKKCGWYLILFLGMLLTPTVLLFIQLMVPLYRSCQYMPLFVAAAALLLYLFLVNGRWKKYGRTIYLFLITVLIWNQTFEMNRNFYTDYRKYEYNRELLSEIAQRVMREYGANVPVIFTGDYREPYELVKYYYASYSSPEYRRVQTISNWIGDPHLIEKFYSPYGYYFGGEAQNSLIAWGIAGSTGPEVLHFLQMHGYEFQAVTDRSIIDKAVIFSEQLPQYPDEGSIVEVDGYVIVHF